MAQFVANCPRCKSQEIAFDVLSCVHVGGHDWQHEWEAFCLCGRCRRTTVFVVRLEEYGFRSWVEDNSKLVKMPGAINDIVSNLGYISLKDKASTPAPEHLPANIRAAFEEGAKCMAIGCFNAAGTMFRLCVDMTSKDKMPEGDAPGLNYKTRHNLGFRLPWLFENRYLPEDLKELSHCTRKMGMTERTKEH